MVGATEGCRLEYNCIDLIITTLDLVKNQCYGKDDKRSKSDINLRSRFG